MPDSPAKPIDPAATAADGELEPMKEETRSAAKELETSKKELQSVNQALSTVNHELKKSVDELSRANADLTDLIASTDIGTIFLDRHLRIQRFTPSVEKIFNLIPGDLGRPLSDITHKLTYADFISDAEKVLHDLELIEREVRAGKTSWYLARIAPYRTAENRSAGVVATFIDVTRRKRAEEKLQESAAALARQTRIFDTTLSSIADFAYIFDKEGKFVFANQPLARLLQLQPEEMVGKNFSDLNYPPELAEKLHRQIRHVFETKQIVRDETPFTNPGGQEGYYEYIFQPLLGPDGKVENVVGSTRDVTHRRKNEQALSESEERFRQFAENSADVFWILDAKTLLLEYLNPVYEKMFGLPREEVMADPQRGLKLVLPEDRQETASGIPRAMAGETFTRIYRIVRPTDGEQRWIRDTGFPIRNEAGEVFRIAGVAQDVTDDRNRAEALEDSEERFRLLVEGARDYAMMMVDPSNTIIYWSAGAERVFGWTADEALGESGELIFTPEDRAREREEKEMEIARVNGVAPDRRWHLRKDGSRIWVDGVMRRLDDENGELRAFAKVARDATDQKTIEEALRHARDEMEQAVLDRTRDLLATNTELEQTMKQRQQLEKELLEISEREKRRIGEDLHDMVCQELTATALLLKSKAKKIESESKVAAEILEESAQTVNRNVGLTRDLARGLQPTDLKGPGLKQALRALADQACESSEIKCHFKAARGVRVTDDTVALHLYRVAQEALKNAVKHSGAKNILIHLDKSETNVCVSVQDDGKGFSVKRRSKGLGLHIMRYRANALGGELKIEKRRNGGMDVTCKIPLKQ